MEIALAEWQKKPQKNRLPVDMRHPNPYNILFNHLIDSRWSVVLITRSTVFLVAYVIKPNGSMIACISTTTIFFLLFKRSCY